MSKKLKAVTNAHITPGFVLTFTAPAEADGLKATHYRIRVTDVTIPKKHVELFVSEIADESATPSVELKKINASLPKPNEVSYKPGVLHEVKVTPLTAPGDKGKKGESTVINFIVNPAGEAEENGHSLDLGGTKAIEDTEPDCNLVGTRMTFVPKTDEVNYDIMVVKVVGETEVAMGSRRVTPVLGNLVVENIFDQMAWVSKNGAESGTYVIRVYAIDATGKQSKAKSFAAREYKFVPPADNKKTEGGNGTGTGSKGDAGTKPTNMPPEDEAALKEVPARLKKIAGDLNALPKDNVDAWNRLTDMALALDNDIIPLLHKVAIFGDKAGADVNSLLTEAKALNDKVETTRAFRSDNWNLRLEPRLRRIGQIIDKLGYQAGEVGEVAFKELATMMAIVKGKNPGMTMKDITVLNASSAQLLRDVEALLAEKEKAEKQNGKGSRTTNPPGKPPGKPTNETSAECPETDAAEIQELYRKIESRLTKPDEETIGAVKALIETLEAKVAQVKKVYLKTDVKSVETNLAWARNTLAGLVEKANRDKNKGANGGTDGKGKEGEDKDKNKKAKGPNMFKSAWNWVQARQRKIWPFLILLLLLLLGWWLYNHFKKEATSVVPSAPATPSVKRQVDSVPPTVQTSSVPATVVGANVAHDIRVRNTFKGGVRGNGNIVGNGQVNISSNYNTYIYNGLGSSTPVKASEPKVDQLPTSLSSDKKCSDGSYRWNVPLGPGQTYCRGTRPGWGLQVNSDAANPMDLTTEIKGLDKQWHMMLPDSTNTVAGTEYRFTVRPGATRAVELNFWLFPTK
jgi:hypothetical protein